MSVTEVAEKLLQLWLVSIADVRTTMRRLTVRECSHVRIRISVQAQQIHFKIPVLSITIGGAIGQLATTAEVKTGSESILIGIKEDIRPVVFVVTIPLAGECGRRAQVRYLLSCATVGLQC